MRIYIKKLQPIFSIVLYIYAYMCVCVCVCMYLFPIDSFDITKTTRNNIQTENWKTIEVFHFEVLLSSKRFEAIASCTRVDLDRLVAIARKIAKETLCVRISRSRWRKITTLCFARPCFSLLCAPETLLFYLSFARTRCTRFFPLCGLFNWTCLVSHGPFSSFPFYFANCIAFLNK